MTDRPPPSGPEHGPRLRTIPAGDDRERLTCPDCGFIAYENPKVVAGVVAVYQDRYLLCRRAIEPRRGYWTIPAGYLELHETTAEGARREAVEEAQADIQIIGLIGLYEIPRISQVYVIHYGTVADGRHEAGPESLETGLFEWDEIPWEDLAFPSVKWALEQHREGHPPSVMLAPHRAPKPSSD